MTRPVLRLRLTRMSTSNFNPIALPNLMTVRSRFVTAVVSGFQASSAPLLLSYVLVPDTRIRSNILSQ